MRLEYSRTPHGVRGLKLVYLRALLNALWSHPAWGAWIEIAAHLTRESVLRSRTPHGVRGLKSLSSRC